MSRDEVFEWACKLAKQYGCHPMRPLGMIDTYLAISSYSYSKAFRKIEKVLEDEANGSKKTKDGTRSC